DRPPEVEGSAEGEAQGKAQAEAEGARIDLRPRPAGRRPSAGAWRPAREATETGTPSGSRARPSTRARGAGARPGPPGILPAEHLDAAARRRCASPAAGAAGGVAPRRQARG